LCGPGAYQPIEGQSFCFTCDPGNFATNGSSTQQQCSRGRYAAGYGNNKCRACQAGEIAASTGSASCTPCGSAYSIDEGNSVCQSCINGAICTNGGIKIEEGYWVYIVNTTNHYDDNTTHVINRRLVTVPCVRGRCRGGEYDGSNEYEACTNYRDQSSTNVMCALCEPQYTEFGDTCISMFFSSSPLSLIIISTPRLLCYQ
jgi:hypothetical protein